MREQLEHSEPCTPLAVPPYRCYDVPHTGKKRFHHTHNTRLELLTYVFLVCSVRLRLHLMAMNQCLSVQIIKAPVWFSFFITHMIMIIMNNTINKC